MVITTIEALKSLTPDAEWSIPFDGVIRWYSNDITQPTQAEIDAEVIRLQAEYDSQDYARSRAKAYPSLQDQADMQYHDAVDGTTTWQEAIKAVKDKYPKN